MAIFSRRFVTTAVVLTVVAAVAAACQSESENASPEIPATSRTASSTMTPVAPAAAVTQIPKPTIAPQPTFSPPPALDRSIASVDLKDIVFDTFDGSSKRLSAASNELIDRLRDAIKPIYVANYEDVTCGDWLEHDDMILGYVSTGGQAYAYPIKFLNFHELVNDEIDVVPLLVTYCPLCGSGVIFDRRLDGEVMVFGNTSALYNSDLVMFDHSTGSYWFQTAGEAVVGTRTGKRLVRLPSSVMSWSLWTELHPTTMVLSREQGLDTRASQYVRDPFSTYAGFLNEGDDRYAFPVNGELVKGTLRPAEVVVAVEIGGDERAYPPERIGDAALNDEIDGEPIVVFSRGDGAVATVFSSVIEGRKLEFELREDSFRDLQTGSMWNMAGVATYGELVGSRLAPLPSRRAFWFSISVSNPDVEVYGQ
ncbi:MAG: DUF3179 domain-containing protein [Chloroflexi bacterium]|nr:DUF3179 domain-containing protein [Chloroflexota bacterium]